MRTIEWSDKANGRFLDILEYWFNRNQSDIYSNKLIDLFHATTLLLAKEPLIGRPSKLLGTGKRLLDFLPLYRHNIIYNTNNRYSARTGIVL